MGWFTVKFTGKYEINVARKTVVFKGCFRVSDTYDWQHPGEKNVTLPTGDIIYDKWAELVENHGYAKPFLIRGGAWLDELKTSDSKTQPPPKRRFF